MYYTGGSALSTFRREKLFKIVPTTLDAHYVYFVDLARTLSESEEKQLRALLPNHSTTQLHLQKGTYFLVIPRTLSPWSSKATDIATVCGLSAVKRIERGVVWHTHTSQLIPFIHDRMTEQLLSDFTQAESTLFSVSKPRVNFLTPDKQGLITANKEYGLALSAGEMDYLVTALKRYPTLVELMMFAQANSEHCRHKIFNADWVIDGQKQTMSLFQMIRHTHEQYPGNVLSAYHDNSAVMKGDKDTAILMKVETHNHPTAISPFPGAATGSGGEIRDEGATGRGSKPKAGLTGFSVSHLRIPHALQAWETPYDTPERMATALQIMLEAPIGASAFNNEFGRPAICGYFRSFEMDVNGRRRGYHKPIMLAGGTGSIRPSHIQKNKIPPESLLIVLGGPAMLIGLGGGAASSMASGHSSSELDFASVQRGNPEMQRRCQEVIDACWRMGTDNPIISIHDVGAGGLSNALPELIKDGGCGGKIVLSDIPSADPSLSPMEIWCNEAQERYVLAIDKAHLSLFASFTERERCPYAVVGETTQAQHLSLSDDLIDMPLSVLLGNPPKMCRDVISSKHLMPPPLDLEHINIQEAILRVLHLPTVANKSFLITIGDRSVGGLVVRDQMVGPWQVPVADCAVTATRYGSTTGEAMAIGERTPLALLNAPASGRIAIGEAITNIAAAYIHKLSDIVFSANWMAAAGQPGEEADLFQTVKAVAMELCPALGIAIPVGKDSLSMHTQWDDKSVTAPLSLIISGFAPVTDIHRSLTPQLQDGDTVLLLIDLGKGQHRLGGSALAQVYNQLGDITPDVDNPQDLKDFFKAIQSLNDKIRAYHDRSEGGLLTTLCEMAFAGHCGIDIHIKNEAFLSSLFTEELGAVIQINMTDLEAVQDWFADNTDLSAHLHILGTPNKSDKINFYHNKTLTFSVTRTTLQRAWSDTSYWMQGLRDNPECAQQEYDLISNNDDPGLSLHQTFEFKAPSIGGNRPKIAILREQGINGHLEMAAAFEKAGFTAIDVHTSDILRGNVSLKDFKGLAASGGFSYGDVLGAGEGWAKSIRFNPRAYDEFSAFFQRSDTFALGVCNGCQMMAHLRDLIPGASGWPTFVRNQSEQFEARLVMVEVLDSPSIFFKGQAGSRLPVIVSHGEGKAEFTHIEKELMALRYVDNQGNMTTRYPANPNGSALGLTGVTTHDGRFTIMMPHPERLFLSSQYSWLPDTWSEQEGPWIHMFWNARQCLS